MNKIIQGDCIEEMQKLPENSIDAIITDPPYGLEFMGKDWDKFKEGKNIAGGNTGKDTPYARSKPTPAFFQHNLKDRNTLQSFCQLWAIECLRVLKPGGYLLSFGGTRTYHRLVCGIEDAGFEIRDTIMWIYGSGFPKSANISLLFDKRECMKQLKEKLKRKPTKEEFKKEWKNFRKVIGKKICGYQVSISKSRKEQGYRPNLTNATEEVNITQPVTEEAKQWEGWGTALKPACEPIVVARKPLSEKNVALNVLKWGTGGINIDECRIECDRVLDKSQDRTMIQRADGKEQGWGMKPQGKTQVLNLEQGRFPANIILDEEAGKMLNEQSGESKSSKVGFDNVGWKHSGNTKEEMTKLRYQQEFKDKGGASRFFYCAKASKSERNFGCDKLEEKEEVYPGANTFDEEGNRLRKDGSIIPPLKSRNNHPTVKPIKLMEYLIKLVSREGAVILDPFIGSGTTAIACLKLNRQFIGIEKEEEYIKIAEARIKPFLEQGRL